MTGLSCKRVVSQGSPCPPLTLNLMSPDPLYRPDAIRRIPPCRSRLSLLLLASTHFLRQRPFHENQHQACGLRLCSGWRRPAAHTGHIDMIAYLILVHRYPDQFKRLFKVLEKAFKLSKADN